MDLANLDPGSILMSILVSGVGFVFFSYGRKQSRFPQMLAGVILMIYPYFIPNPWAMLGVGAGICALTWAAIRFLGVVNDPRIAHAASLDGAWPLLSSKVWAVTAPVVSPESARAWIERVLAARPEWTSAFRGEQHSLGRAFYTHDEEGHAAEYFREAAVSDARVEAHLPGMQQAMRDHLSRAVGAEVRPRLRWCGAGVHVFPAGEHVAHHGGVVHSDHEGLTDHHRRLGLPAVTLVVMLSALERGGGLRLWARRQGDPEDARSSARARLDYRPGDGVLMDSYRHHQIEPFADAVDRLSITLHAARTESGAWESWF